MSVNVPENFNEFLELLLLFGSYEKIHTNTVCNLLHKSLKGHSTNFSHEIKFTHLEYYSVYENSFIMFSVALEKAFQMLKK